MRLVTIPKVGQMQIPATLAGISRARPLFRPVRSLSDGQFIGGGGRPGGEQRPCRHHAFVAQQVRAPPRYGGDRPFESDRRLCVSVAQLAARNLAEVEAAGSIPVAHSKPL